MGGKFADTSFCPFPLLIKTFCPSLIRNATIPSPFNQPCDSINAIQFTDMSSPASSSQCFSSLWPAYWLRTLSPTPSQVCFPSLIFSLFLSLYLFVSLPSVVFWDSWSNFGRVSTTRSNCGQRVFCFGASLFLFILVELKPNCVAILSLSLCVSVFKICEGLLWWSMRFFLFQ